MGLPKLTTPEFPLEIPSTKQKVSIRPFLAKEEKILLMAKQSEDSVQIQHSILQIIENCITKKPENFNMESLSTFDIEYLYVKLYSISVTNVISLKVNDQFDKMCEVDIDLDKVSVVFPESHKTVFNIQDDIYVEMKYPTISVVENQSTIDVICDCIKTITQGEVVYNATEYTKNELVSFVEGFTTKNLQEISEQFFNTLPRTQSTVSYKNSKGKIVEYTVEGLQNFFT